MTTAPAIQSPAHQAPAPVARLAATDDAAIGNDLDITHVAERIARDGIGAHHQTLVSVADRAAEADVLPGASAVLRDSKAPEAARGRAFLVIARQWDTISVAFAQKAAFDRSFAALSTQWVAHQELRSHGAISQLAQSGERLNELRLQTRHSLAGS